MLDPPTFCSLCRAKKFKHETEFFCCDGGNVRLAPLVYPPQLLELLCSQSERGAHFRKYIRLYKKMFAFSSLRGTIDYCIERGIYVFKIDN